jgi:hypothetical protein
MHKELTMFGRQLSPQKIQAKLELTSRPQRRGWDLSPTDDVGPADGESLLNHATYFGTKHPLRGTVDRFGWLETAAMDFRFITRTNGLGNLAIARLGILDFGTERTAFMYLTTQQETFDGGQLSSEHVAIKGVQNLLYGHDEQQSAWLGELQRTYSSGTPEAWQRSIDQLTTYTPETVLATS